MVDLLANHPDDTTSFYFKQDLGNANAVYGDCSVNRVK